MKVEVRNGDRYMLDDAYDMAKFATSNAKESQKAIDDEAAHAAWFTQAKAEKTHDARDAIILGDARSHLMSARMLKSPVAEKEDSLQSRWLPWSQSYFDAALKFETCRDVLHFAQERIPFDHRTHLKEGHKEEFQIYEKLLTEEFPFRMDTQFNLSDNPKSIPETLYRTYGRLVSNVFYWHLRIMFRCQADISPLESILEVGGGYGSLARLWMMSAKIKRYVIVDLPESLFYSEVCLREVLGLDQVGYWEGKDPGTRVVLVPIGRLHEYTQKSDLVLNVGSLQEMSDVWVSFYMDWLDKYQTNWFYSLNYMGQPLTQMHESRNFWAPRPSRQWATRLLNADVPVVKMMCSGRDFVEAIYERAAPGKFFHDWSVLHGAFFNRATYLEGLELLRQEFTGNNAKAFISVVVDANNRKTFLCPKELLFVANVVHASTGDPTAKALFDQLANTKKTGTY